jgi:hypothetical protein
MLCRSVQLPLHEGLLDHPLIVCGEWTLTIKILKKDAGYVDADPDLPDIRPFAIDLIQDLLKLWIVGWLGLLCGSDLSRRSGRAISPE